MSTVTVDFNDLRGRIKPMHAVNNGPAIPSSVEQTRGNFEAYASAHIPFARNHDASFQSVYGGEHTVDVHAVFPDFNQNPYDPRSYDFALTDDYLQTISSAGTEVYYRLGSKIEHWRKKYGTIVPADFHKWAVICEHIIRHYNEGWADGFHLGITYWEIWNEPDGVKSNGDQPNWSGTPEQYYELYVESARHLKKCFPHLKIGGPAMSTLTKEGWIRRFFDAIRTNQGTPLDFFSWHCYSTDPALIAVRARRARELLDEGGFTQTESHLNEWNYLENFQDKFVPSILAISGMRGAAFVAAVMAVAQHEPLDMLMYYDARIGTVFNGMFDFYTLEPRKAYYSFLMFSKLYELGNEASVRSDEEDVYAVAASGSAGKAVMVTYYSKDRTAPPKDIIICGLSAEEVRCELLDEQRTMEPSILRTENDSIHFTLQNESVVLLTMK